MRAQGERLFLIRGADVDVLERDRYGQRAPPSHAGESQVNAPASFGGSAQRSGRPPCVHVYVHGGSRVLAPTIQSLAAGQETNVLSPPVPPAHVVHSSEACDRLDTSHV
jgi:hypothetical protein